MPKKNFFRPERFPVLSSESIKILEILRRNNPSSFLSKYIWRKHGKNKKAVGFKIFYYHAKEGNWKSVWDIIENDKSIKIIHLHRKNRLNTFLSLEKARRSNLWHGDKIDQSPIVLDPKACEEFFQEFEDYEKEFDNKFPDHDQYKLYYEFLNENKAGCLKEICAFLNVNNFELKSTMKKIQKKSIAESIANYAELKDSFNSTKWIKFFK